MAVKIITFLRKRDYRLVKELGQGSCGRTVLLHDDIIDEDFVCKKYVPFSNSYRQELFAKFAREIKLLYKIHHHNVVRIFNHYLYPEDFAGYILMEYVEGCEIDEYVASAPETIDELFVQAVAGFRYLESRSILHRDIRVSNILVRADGTLKIIDLGFGKAIEIPEDYDKSISLNWWCELPDEFSRKFYDFQTEVYFVGKLFEQLIVQNSIEECKYASLIAKMCQRNPLQRIASFSDIEKALQSDQFSELEFTDDESDSYRSFANQISTHITKIEYGAKYRTDIERIEIELQAVYRTVMLEQLVPDSAPVIRCFLTGVYYYRKEGFPVPTLKDFIHLLKSASMEKKRIILSNLQAKMDAIKRYEQPKPQEPNDDDIPF